MGFPFLSHDAYGALLGYDHDNYKNHSCKGKWCLSCKQDDCPDYLEAKRPLPCGQFPKPHELCNLCHHKFFGDQCYNYHLQRRSQNIKSICDTFKKCPDCCHVYELDKKVRHRGNRHRPEHVCGLGECNICKKKVKLDTHQCCIQRIPEEEDDP